MRVASIDIGTNTVVLLVAERSASGLIEAIAEDESITRLGEGVDRDRVLKDDAMDRTAACVERYAARIAELRVDRIAVVGTSAMRDARGGETFVRRVHASLGVAPRVLSGEDEARLTFLGATSAARNITRPQLVFDIGAGSTEVICGDHGADGARISFAQSFAVGSLRLTERHVRSDPPSPLDLGELASAARTAFATVPCATGDVVGVAGTMSTLAAVWLGRVGRAHGATMPTSGLRRTVAALAALPLARRRWVTGVPALRADVIVAGGTIALAVLERARVEAFRVSERGVQWGLAEELFCDAAQQKEG